MEKVWGSLKTKNETLDSILGLETPHCKFCKYCSGKCEERFWKCELYQDKLEECHMDSKCRGFVIRE